MRESQTYVYPPHIPTKSHGGPFERRELLVSVISKVEADAGRWRLFTVSSTTLFVSQGYLRTFQIIDLNKFYDYCLTIRQEVLHPCLDRGPHILSHADKICMED